MNAWKSARRTSSCEAPVPPMKKKFLRWVIVGLGAVLALLIAALLSRDIILKSLATRGIEEETGLRAVIGELTTTLGSGALQIF